MPSALFEFFEIVAEELCVEDSRVLTRVDLQVRDDDGQLLDDLKRLAMPTQELIGLFEDVSRRRGLSVCPAELWSQLLPN